MVTNAVSRPFEDHCWQNRLSLVNHVTYREMLAHLRVDDDILRMGFMERFPIIIYNYHYK